MIESKPRTDAVPDLVITRTFAVSPELVFRAWTEPVHLAQWWGTTDMTGVASEIDLRAGGAWRACMRSPEGIDHWACGRFLDIDEPRHLVMTFAWEATGGPETVLTISLESRGTSTVMTFRQSGFTSPGSRDGHEGGWNESFDKLDGYLMTIA